MPAADRLAQLCEESRWPVERVTCACKADEYVARRVMFAMALHTEGYGISEIGRALHRDHATVSHYVYVLGPRLLSE